MEHIPELLLELRHFKKLYESASRPVCRAHGLTQTELDVIGFLDNHPHEDTASDITELRMLPKANVSQAVEVLIQKGMLRRVPDEADRRRLHLCLTAAGRAVAVDIRASRLRMTAILEEGFTAEEWEQYQMLHRRMKENACRFLEREDVTE